MTDPKAIHDMEQLTAGLRIMAAAVYGYYAALVEEGFDHTDAMELTCLYQVSLSEPEEDDE